jgi:hypothetical protein
MNIYIPYEGIRYMEIKKNKLTKRRRKKQKGRKKNEVV